MVAAAKAKPAAAMAAEGQQAASSRHASELGGSLRVASNPQMVEAEATAEKLAAEMMEEKETYADPNAFGGNGISSDDLPGDAALMSGGSRGKGDAHNTGATSAAPHIEPSSSSAVETPRSKPSSFVSRTISLARSATHTERGTKATKASKSAPAKATEAGRGAPATSSGVCGGTPATEPEAGSGTPVTEAQGDDEAAKETPTKHHGLASVSHGVGSAFNAVGSGIKSTAQSTAKHTAHAAHSVGSSVAHGIHSTVSLVKFEKVRKQDEEAEDELLEMCATGDEKTTKSVFAMLGDTLVKAPAHEVMRTAGFITEVGRKVKAGKNKVVESTFINSLKGSNSLVGTILRNLVPRMLGIIENFVESELLKLHLTGGLKLAEKGVLANYKVEVFRLNDSGSQAFRLIPAKDKTPPHYKLVRKANLFEPTEKMEPRKVHPKGIIKRLSCSIKPRALSVESDAFRNARGSEDLDGDGVPDKLEGTDVWLHQKFKCAPPIAKCLQKHLPPPVKAHLPFQVADNWMPIHMRDEPEKARAMHSFMNRSFDVIINDVDLDFTIRFDVPDPILKSEKRKKGLFSRYAPKIKEDDKSDFNFEVSVSGGGCWPSLGAVQIRWLTLESHARIWWDVLDEKLDIAFLKEDPPDVNWDLEISFFGCGLPLPDCIEDGLLGKLGDIVMASFNQMNPISLDFKLLEQQAISARKAQDAMSSAITVGQQAGIDVGKAAVAELRGPFKHLPSKRQTNTSEDAVADTTLPAA